MFSGSRVTDAVDFFKRRGELRGAVKVVRGRPPERLRWRNAVGALTGEAGCLRGLERMRVEEPVREMVIDLPDLDLQRSVVLDARKSGVDLDRGEVLPVRNMADVRRFAFLTRVDLSKVHKYVKLPHDFGAVVDGAGVAVVGRAYAEAHQKRAHRLWLQLPDPDAPEELRKHQRLMKQRADEESRRAQQWAAFTRAMMDPRA